MVAPPARISPGPDSCVWATASSATAGPGRCATWPRSRPWAR